MNRRTFIGLLGLLGCKEEIEMDKKKLDWWRQGSASNSPATEVLGDLYNKSSWADLTDFTSFGTPNITASGNKLVLSSAGAGTTAHGLTFNFRKTLLEKWTMVVDFVISVTPAADTYGIGLAMRSINAWAAVQQKRTVFASFDTTNTANKGKVTLFASLNNTNYTQLGSQSSALSYTNGDDIRMTFERNGWTITVTALNIDTGLSVSTTYTFVPGTTGGLTQPNAGQFAIHNMKTAMTINSVTINSQSLKNCNLMAIGDSKISGYKADIIADRFADLLNADYPTTIVEAGPSDRTVEIIQCIDEIVELNPRQVILSVGRNDLASSVASGTWQANLDSIVSSLWFCEKVLLLVIEPDLQSQTALKTYIDSKGWDKLYVSGITLDADSIHPNTTGHSEIYDDIIADNQLT